MKRLFVGFASLALIVALSAFTPAKTPKKENSQPGSSFSMPDSVKAIVDHSCFMCHNSNARGDAKDKLNFDELSSMKGPQLVANLANMAKMIKNDWMPPRKFLKDHPEMALTAQQKQVLLEWIKAENNKIFSEN
ncbi:MAG: heme-binding domain-containing protein [Bacteroidales bacterium]|nr:heme-binding domain-containing protein [Bacteroidales bacterium]